MVKICDNCNNEIEDDGNFCPHCGSKVSGEDVKICSACGTKNTPDAKFCTNCGNNFFKEPKGNFKSFMGNIVEGVKGTIGEERTEEYKQSIDKIQKNINNKYQGFKSNVAADVLSINFVETEGFYYIQANVAGLEKEQISIEPTDNSISIKVVPNNVLENIKDYDESSSILIRNEFKNSVNERTFNFDESILNEEIETEYKNGVLLITIPKKEITENFEEKKISFEKDEIKETFSNVSKKVEDVAVQTSDLVENKGKNIKTKFMEDQTSDSEKFKELTGGLTFNKDYQNRLDQEGLSIDEGMKIKSILKEEIQSGIINDDGVEIRLEELINDFKSKKAELEDVLDYIDEFFECEEAQYKITEYHFNNFVVNQIRNELKKEVKKDFIAKDEVPNKVLEKIDSEYEKEKEMGIAGYDFKCTLYEIRQGTFGQKEDVMQGFCFVEEDKLVIKKISSWLKHDKGDKIIPFANVNAVDYDKAGGLQMTSSIVIAISGVPPIVLRHTTQEDFELVHQAWLDYNNLSKNTDKVDAPTQVNSADELMKYAELYEKGILSEDEFAAMKQKIINQ